MHMKSLSALLALALLGAGPQDRKSRPFNMGVTGMPHDMSEEGMQTLLEFVKNHTDLFPQKIDGGVPWPEAFAGKPYEPEFEKALEEKAAFRPAKLYLQLTPLNGEKDGLGPYRGKDEGEPLPEPWASRDFDDVNVVRAYANYCKDMIRRFKPDYLAYALEANAQAKNPARWKKFLAFCREVYVAIKRDHRELPVFVTLSLETYAENESNQKRAAREILAFSDLVAVGTLPYIHQPNPAKIPRDYFSRITALAPGKPFAVETGFLAEDLQLPGLGERFGKPGWQDDYLKFVLDESARLNGKYVIWVLARDFDALWNRAAKDAPDSNELAYARLFRDTGLLDGDGKPRKAFETWSAWLKLPKK